MSIVGLLVLLVLGWIALRFFVGVFKFLVLAAIVIGGALYLWGQAARQR